MTRYGKPVFFFLSCWDKVVWIAVIRQQFAWWDWSWSSNSIKQEMYAYFCHIEDCIIQFYRNSGSHYLFSLVLFVHVHLCCKKNCSLEWPNNTARMFSIWFSDGTKHCKRFYSTFQHFFWKRKLRLTIRNLHSDFYWQSIFK